ncbi:MAG TPA: GNAT family N-acetyltransferase [Ohtaekwangia sp.]|nr:GNAT family N-acetyltransferase [Ohtaekwangia sp.]
MGEIQLKLDDNGRGALLIDKDGDRLAEMGIGIANGNLTVYHTGVSERLQGQGIASKLLAIMVDYARKHQLKVIALCPFVLARFKRHPEQYADIWNKHWHSKA